MKSAQPSKEQQHIAILAYIFQSRPLTILEALVRHLVEERQFNYHSIGILIKRDERNIRDIYLHARAKQDKIISPPLIKADFLIPLSVFADRKVSVMEALVTFLKTKYSLSFIQIAKLLQRDERTIWTAYHRAKKKYEK